MFYTSAQTAAALQVAEIFLKTFLCTLWASVAFRTCYSAQAKRGQTPLALARTAGYAAVSGAYREALLIAVLLALSLTLPFTPTVGLAILPTVSVAVPYGTHKTYRSLSPMDKVSGDMNQTLFEISRSGLRRDQFAATALGPTSLEGGRWSLETDSPWLNVNLTRESDIWTGDAGRASDCRWHGLGPVHRGWYTSEGCATTAAVRPSLEKPVHFRWIMGDKLRKLTDNYGTTGYIADKKYENTSYTGRYWVLFAGKGTEGRMVFESDYEVAHVEDVKASELLSTLNLTSAALTNASVLAAHTFDKREGEAVEIRAEYKVSTSDGQPMLTGTLFRRRTRWAGTDIGRYELGTMEFYTSGLTKGRMELGYQSGWPMQQAQNRIQQLRMLVHIAETHSFEVSKISESYLGVPVLLWLAASTLMLCVGALLAYLEPKYVTNSHVENMFVVNDENTDDCASNRRTTLIEWFKPELWARSDIRLAASGDHIMLLMNGLTPKMTHVDVPLGRVTTPMLRQMKAAARFWQGSAAVEFWQSELRESEGQVSTRDGPDVIRPNEEKRTQSEIKQSTITEYPKYRHREMARRMDTHHRSHDHA